MSADRVAVLLDGEYVKKVLGQKLKIFPTSKQVVEEVSRILRNGALEEYSLYRVFYYTANPLSAKATHPLTKSTLNFGTTNAHSRNLQLIDSLENEPDFAVRRGTLAHQGWEIGPAAVKLLLAGDKTEIEPQDIIPKITQKGVDMRIGLDIASLAIKRLVSAIVLVTGDADLVPAMKVARREGLRVFLDTISHPSVRPELKLHADRIIS